VPSGQHAGHEIVVVPVLVVQVTYPGALGQVVLTAEQSIVPVGQETVTYSHWAVQLE
jgi:hypothetical protein